MATPYRCISSQCRDSGKANETVYLEKDNLVCPRCGNARENLLIKLAIIHLLVPKVDGPMKGSEKDFILACEPAQKAFAAGRKINHYTDILSAVTCQLCIAAAPEPTTEEDEV